MGGVVYWCIRGVVLWDAKRVGEGDHGRVLNEYVVEEFLLLGGVDFVCVFLR